MLALWSKHLESTRKDVERTFGVMKKRFNVLKVPLLFRNVTFVNDIFVTCAVLHNMLLEHDHQFKVGHFRLLQHRERRRTVLINNVQRLLSAQDDFSFMGNGTSIDPDDPEGTVTQVDSKFNSMRQVLAEHTYYLYVNRRLIR